jgi:hypothetical protein
MPAGRSDVTNRSRIRRGNKADFVDACWLDRFFCHDQQVPRGRNFALLWFCRVAFAELIAHELSVVGIRECDCGRRQNAAQQESIKHR